MFITDAILEQIVQALAAHLWSRPELTLLRQPVEQVLNAGAFRTMTRQAFETFNMRVSTTLPDHFDAGFIAMPAVQAALAGYIVQGKPIDTAELARLYGKRHLSPADAPDASTQIDGYLKALRETFALHPTYGPILLARDVQEIFAALLNLRDEVRRGFTDLSADIAHQLTDFMEQLRQHPAVKVALEHPVSGGHIFLSYSRYDAAFAFKLKADLERAGHTVWIDVSDIKGGDEWISAITESVSACAAMVSLVSPSAQESKWVRREFLFAEHKKKLIIPVWVEPCDPPLYMIDLNILHGYDPHYDDALARLLNRLPVQKPVADSPLAPATRTIRQLEEAYLDRLWLEHKLWQDTYTPMAGVGQMRQPRASSSDKPQIVTVPTDISARFKQRMKATLHSPEAPLPVEEKQYDDILPAVEQMRQLVVLGDPGSGKTTTLWRIAADYAQRAKDDPAAPLPIFLRLGGLEAHDRIDDRLNAQLGDLSFEALLGQKRVALLLDGLNELPKDNRAGNVAQIKALIERCRSENLIAVVTCRELDYTDALDMRIPERVTITPLDPLRIRRFVNGYIKEPPGKGDELFWALAGERARELWERFVNAVGDDEHTFWLAETLPEGKRWSYDWDSSGNAYWTWWLRVRKHPRSLLELATNPYMLFMMTQVFGEEGRIPPNRGELFSLFVDFLLLDRERLSEHDADQIKTRLADLGYAMQAQGEGTLFSREAALIHLQDEMTLYRALSANLLDGSDNMRFTHQLLQEYFAAQRLNREMRSGTPAAQFWQPDQWWQPAGWEETAVLLAGLYSDDTTTVIEWLRDAQPELTERCIRESGAHTPAATVQALKPRWLPRLTDMRTDPNPRARAAVGRTLGRLNLDDRPGVGLRPDGLPDIAWAEAVLPGSYPLGGGAFQSLPAQTVELDHPYWLAKYPVTYAQYEAFVRLDGYTKRAYWTDAGWDWKGDKTQPERYWNDPQWHIANHPVVGVSWYEAVAFTRWLDALYRQHNLWDDLVGTTPASSGGLIDPAASGTLIDPAASAAIDPILSGGRTTPASSLQIRLPTEIEWEIAARGADGLVYPYGNTFDAAQGNAGDTGIGRTSAVGIFPDGASPCGALDMSGNIWEWCLTGFKSGSNDINRTEERVLRGGSWGINGVTDLLRAACRIINTPDDWNYYGGFRVARSR